MLNKLTMIKKNCRRSAFFQAFVRKCTKLHTMDWCEGVDDLREQSLCERNLSNDHRSRVYRWPYTDKNPLHWRKSLLQWGKPRSMTNIPYTDINPLHWRKSFTLTKTRYTKKNPLHWRKCLTLTKIPCTDSFS